MKRKQQQKLAADFVAKSGNCIKCPLFANDCNKPKEFAKAAGIEYTTIQTEIINAQTGQELPGCSKQ